MIPLKPEDLQSGKIRAAAMDMSTETTQELSTKNGSTSHFFEPFESCGYKIQLRLDWNDLDSQCNPMLDADFYNPITGKMDKSMKSHPAHHTQAQGNGERIYIWKFLDDLRMLCVALIWSESLTSTIGITDYCSAELIRNGKVIP